MVRYSHRQNSYFAMVAAPFFAAAFIWGFLTGGPSQPPPRFIPVAVIVILPIGIAIFSTMIIEVTDHDIAVGFLFGAMRRRVPLGDIVRAEPTRISWWHGVGVRYGWKTTTYLIRTGPAVALTLASGRVLRIGTDEPDALLAALKG